MTVKDKFSESERFVLEELRNLNFPPTHPFNEYPNTPESMPLQMIIIIHSIFRNDNMVLSFLKKCKGIENNEFSPQKYFQGLNEVLWLYYLTVGLIKNDSFDKIENIFDENNIVYDNDKKFEFSVLLNNVLDKTVLINWEVKTLLCDPFEKEGALPAKDGHKLMKPLFPDVSCKDFLKTETDITVLKASTYYYQTNQNIKRIINKCRGNNVTDYDLFNIGVLFINMSTSYEEFYSYLFHKTKGIYSKLLKSNVDAVVLISLDAHNDKMLDNVYSMGYIQTLLIKPTDRNFELCKILRMDNYISQGKDILKEVYIKGQEEFGRYKILNRSGYINIIPQDSSEEEITQYLDYLQSDNIRY